MVRAGFQKAPLAVNPDDDGITETILQIGDDFRGVTHGGPGLKELRWR